MAGADTVGKKQPQMLHVALAPAAVALQLVEQRRRRLFVAAGEIAREPNLPPGAPHERRLDEIVAHDLAAERRLSRQPAETAMLDERLDTDDRVVSPVGALAQLPVVEAG